MPTVSLENLVRRAGLIRDIRDFFDRNGFFEVETPILSRDVIVDRHLEPFSLDIHGEMYFLQTSPEFAMKRLLAAGAGAIYQITRVFRQDDRGVMHNPEFTMLEWYRIHDDYQQGMRFLGQLIQTVLNRGNTEFVTLRQLFMDHTGLNPHQCNVIEFRDFSRQKGLIFPESFGVSEQDRDDWVDFLFSEVIQSNIGHKTPVIVYDYPETQSQLARTAHLPEEQITVSERFELFVDGMELANGYHELLDADVLEQRFRKTNALRVSDGKKPLPVESRLLAAMRTGLPPCCGVALGLDRLIMVALKAAKIDEVIAFPLEQA